MPNQIKAGAAISYTAILVNTLLGLLYTPWMVKQIGTSDYGLYSLIGAFLSYFILDFGLGEAIARYISLVVAKKEYEKVSCILSTALRIYLIIDLIVFVVLCVCYGFLENIFGSLTPLEIEKLKVIFCIAGFFSLCSFPLMPINGTLIAHERFICLKLSDLTQKVLVVVLTVIVLLLGYGLYALVLINGLLGLLVAIYKYGYAKKKINLNIDLRIFDRSLAKSLFKFSIWVFVIGIAQRLTINISPTILGMRASTLQISVYAIAAMLEAHTWNFANALNGLFMPRVANLTEKGSSRKEVTDLMIKVGRVQLFVTGLIITGFLLVGKSFIQLWMGTSFQMSYYVAMLIICPGIITLTQSIANTLLYVENEIRYRAILFFSSSLVSCVLSYILSQQYGALGCGIGISFSIIVCQVLGMNIVYRYKLKLDIVRFFKECHLKMMVPMVITVVLFVVIKEYVAISTWINLLIMVAGYILTYVFLMWILSLNSFEKGLFLSIVNRIRNKR